MTKKGQGGPVRGGRIVYSKGPIVRAIEVVSFFSGLIATVALILTLLLWSGQLDQFQASRVRASTDSCLRLRKIIAISAAAHPNQSSPKTLKKFYKDTGLNNCKAYGLSITQLK